MNITKIKELLKNIKLSSETYEITTVEYSKDPDFSLIEAMGANPMNMMTDYKTAIANLNPFYRIALTVKSAPGSNILMEVWLPESTWTGRAIMIGNGGSAMGISHLALIGAMQDNFAAFHCNLSTAPDMDRGVNTPGVWADFGWRATHLTTVIGKQIVEMVYGKPANHTYYYGCSTGGQQGISAAELFPEDFDGIAAVAPAFSRTYLHIFFVWNCQNLINPDGSFVFDAAEVQKLSDISIAYFQSRGDGAPGDGFVTNPYLTDTEKEEIFAQIKAANFLSTDKLEKLWKVYQGPINPRTGERIYCGYAMGAEGGFMGLDVVKMPGYTYEFLYPARWAVGQKFADFDIYGFDFDKDTDKTLVLAKDLNTDSGELDAFKKVGGKLIMTSGAMDAVVPEPNISCYYDRVVEKQGGLENTREFFRYFLVPGMSHSIKGGSGIDYMGTMDGDIPLSAGYIPVANWDAGLVNVLIDWVENGNAPECIMGTGFNAMNFSGMVAETAKGIRLQRPVYAYPDETVYVGGDTSAPTSFAKKEGGLKAREPRAERYWKYE